MLNFKVKFLLSTKKLLSSIGEKFRLRKQTVYGSYVLAEDPLWPKVHRLKECTIFASNQSK